jgi:hypothetical protein
MLLHEQDLEPAIINYQLKLEGGIIYLEIKEFVIYVELKWEMNIITL